MMTIKCPLILAKLFHAPQIEIILLGGAVSENMNLRQNQTKYCDDPHPHHHHHHLAKQTRVNSSGNFIVIHTEQICGEIISSTLFLLWLQDHKTKNNTKSSETKTTDCWLFFLLPCFWLPVHFYQKLPVKLISSRTSISHSSSPAPAWTWFWPRNGKTASYSFKVLLSFKIST